MKWNAEGVSSEDIAQRLGITPFSVRRHLHKFIESVGKAPTGLTVTEVQLRRVEEDQQLQWYMRQIAQRVTALDPNAIDFGQKCRAIEVTTKAGDAYARLSARRAALWGLDAPVQPRDVTNILNVTDDIRRNLELVE